ncbi:MAG TPA: phosphopantetheine-binding protein [Terriglobales bacterium]|jgi:acyl carrier protein|nr:phosphopantetheine-binding protein [Terriglobales bacterium]
MPDPLAEKVMALIAAVKRIPPEQVSLDKTFEELGMDSLDNMNLLFEVESTFNISIPDEEARAIRNVRQVVDGVRKLVGAAPGTGAPAQPAPAPE